MISGEIRIRNPIFAQKNYSLVYIFSVSFQPMFLCPIQLSRRTNRTKITQTTRAVLLCAPPTVSGHHAPHPHLCPKYSEIETTRHPWPARAPRLRVPRVTARSMRQKTLFWIRPWLLALQPLCTMPTAIVMAASVAKVASEATAEAMLIMHALIITTQYPFPKVLPRLASHRLETAESFP